MRKYLRWPPPTKGFSLIELAIVMALIALLAVLSHAQSGFLTRMMVRAELEHLYTLCYAMQRKALMLNRPQSVSFDVENQSYKAGDRLYRLPAHVRFGVAPGVKGPPSSPENVITNPITFPQKMVTFHADGVIQSGAVYLTDRSGHCTYALSCAVSQVSYLRKYQYTTSWQLISE